VTEIYDCSRAPEWLRRAVKGGARWIDSMTATLGKLDALTAESREPRVAPNGRRDCGRDTGVASGWAVAKFLLFRLENLTRECFLVMLGNMASYLGTRRRHVDFLTVISSGCRTR